MGLTKIQTELFRDKSEDEPSALCLSAEPVTRAIEDSLFPFEEISKIAEQESWRKEINRPVYHIHKWWAQRLGSVFRALVLGTFAPKGANVVDLFYSPFRINNAVVFDPFMGSGTTLGEVLKAGGKAIGRDINPVAHFLVKNALNLPNRDQIISTFKEIEADTAPDISKWYTASLPDGQHGQVLYYFWVKTVECVHCEHSVDLFPSYVFAQHAYTKRVPGVRIICRGCGQVFAGTFGAKRVKCPDCNLSFDPTKGPAHRNDATCPNCTKTFRILEAVKRRNKPPDHRQYAKLVLRSDGEKVYLATNEHDRHLYDSARRELSNAHGYPTVQIKPGYNTKQVLNYCYRSWDQMFNARQLLCLSILAKRIAAIPDQRQRELFCCLFSGTLEFNNMFASYKGEGTGAVRHMFYHHILKPERTPLEANIWGTPKSSGGFSTLFKRRILRAIDYAERPFEIKTDRAKAKKVFDLSEPLTAISTAKRLILECGDSSFTGLAASSVDAVITDPPFFDNVHYSELADFFFVWQRHVLGENGSHQNDSTRASEEVQHADAAIFEDRLSSVWLECRRVLKLKGLLIFTFHHSRHEGWRSLLGSLARGGFQIVAVHPIRSEMSVAAPKHQAKEPIALDVVFVCRKHNGTIPVAFSGLRATIHNAAREQLERLSAGGFNVSRNDIRLLVFSHAIRVLSQGRRDVSTQMLRQLEPEIELVALALAESLR
jgi:putative DNA methylase